MKYKPKLAAAKEKLNTLAGRPLNALSPNSAEYLYLHTTRPLYFTKDRTITDDLALARLWM
jgi:hypothetical protein